MKKKNKNVKIIVEKFVRDCDEAQKITYFENFDELKKVFKYWFIYRGMFFGIKENAIFVYVKKDINKEHPLDKNYRWLR
jgi:hypothetical protein